MFGSSASGFRGSLFRVVMLAATVLCAAEIAPAQTNGPRRGALFQGYLVPTEDCCPPSVAVGDVDPRDAAMVGPVRDRGRATRDLVFANTNDSVTVVLNEGTGTFGSARTYSVGDRPYTVALGDVSGDGLLDIVSANENAKTVTVLLNAGGGVFARMDYPIGAKPYAIASGDVNGDGLADLAIASYDTDAVILLRNAGGMFLAPESIPVGSGPWSVALGDLDGDGALEIVTAHRRSGLGGAVSVTRNLGAGAFGTPVAYPLPDAATSVALADLGHDGRLDVVATLWPLGRGKLVVLDNLGGAEIGDPRAYPIGTYPEALVLADVTGDALPDAITPHGATVGYIEVTANRGGGDFGGRDVYDVISPSEAHLADLTGDGWLDVVLVGSSIRILPSTGGGALGAMRTYPTGMALSASDVAFGDVDGDGAIDVVTVSGSFSTGGAVTVFPNQGAGSFGPSQSYPVGNTAVSVALADLDADGRLDIAAANYGDSTVSVLTNLGGGAFANRRDYAVGEQPGQVVLADVSGDGLVDLVTRNEMSSILTPQTLTTLLNQGAGLLGGRQDSIVGTNMRELELGQVEGDSLPDAVVVNYGDPSGSVTVLRNDGAGKFTVVAQYAVGPRPESLELGDVDGNGELDIATANSAGESITIWLHETPRRGAGASGFGARKEYTVGVTTLSIALGDVDRDGRLDAVTANDQSDDVTVLRQVRAAPHSVQPK